MHLRLLHRTTFTYSGNARDSFNEARLRPVDDALQTCRSFALRTKPAVVPRDYLDFYGNVVHYFDISTPHRKLVIEAESEIETAPNAARPAVPEVPVSALETSPDREIVGEFLNPSHFVPADVTLWHEAKEALASGRTTVFADATRLARHVFRTFTYKPNSTGVNTGAVEALKLRAGVCQDFAHVTLGLCRNAGIPARYVSGYFFNEKRRPDENEASHAWIEVCVPGFGWAGYDPTHDRAPDERYVKVAGGRDYADIRPVSGTYRGAPTRSLKVEVSVRAAGAPVVATPGA
jgi:transglutaminase-like putative cysteine protease